MVEGKERTMKAINFGDFAHLKAEWRAEVPPPAPAEWGWHHIDTEAASDVLKAKPAHPFTDGCELCHQMRGSVLSEIKDNGMTYEVLIPCPHCSTLRDRCQRITRAKLPAKFDGHAFDWSLVSIAFGKQNTAQDQLMNWADTVAEGKGAPSIALLGPTGRGKSHAAFMLAKHLLSRDVPVRWTFWSSLLNKLRSTYDKSSREREYDIIEAALPSRGVLILDDLGEGQNTEWTRGIATRIFEAKPPELTMLVTSNGHPDDSDENSLSRMIGTRATSRMFGICGRGRAVLIFDGDDWRRAEQ